MPDRVFRLAVALMVPALVATGCKKATPPESSAPPPQPVEVRLQVTSINPSTVQPQAAVAGKVYGSAFEGGASVEFMGPLRERVAGEGVSVDSENTISLTIPALDAGSYDVVVTNAGGESSTLRGGLQVKAAGDCDNVTVNFDLDSSRLRADARNTLNDHVACLQSLTGTIRVEGHCDERGTVDYNSLLGQRRAESVKSFLVTNGVSSSRVKTVSYGEERPIDTRHNEAAWAKNRRAEIKATE